MKAPRLSVILLGAVALAMIVFMIVRVVSAPLPASPPAPQSPPAETPEAPAPVTPTSATTPPTDAASISQPYPDEATLRLLEQINALRLEAGAWPLKPNPTLNRLAQGQAGYLATLPTLSTGEAAHLGAEGNNAVQRARALGWPDYGSPDRVEVAEAIGATPAADKIVEAWRRSPPDLAILVSDAYREIGLASVALPDRALAVAVLGSRPGILPALIDPASHALHLTSERSAYASGGEWIGEATRVQIIGQSAAGSVNEDAWVAWSPTLPAPASIAPFSVAYSDGERTVITSVDPLIDIAWLPGGGPIAAIFPTLATQAPSPAALPTLTPPKLPGASPAPNDGLTLVYDERSLAVINTTGGLTDLRNLRLVGANYVLPGSLWDTPWLDVRIYLFPAGDCVQVWAWNEPNPGPPAECRFMRAAIYLAPTELFWREGTFDALWKDEKAATCEAAAGRCVVVLPQNP